MMAIGDSSQASTPARAKQSATYQLTLVTLAGEEIQLPIELQEFCRLCEFENAVLECLSTTSMISAFGRELELVGLSTQTILGDPIWNTLQECNRFSLVVRQCFVTAEHKGQLRQRAKAICVPAEDTDFVLPNAFSYVPDLRHVLVETGIQTIGASGLSLAKLSTATNCQAALHCRLSPRWCLSGVLCAHENSSPWVQAIWA